MRLRVLACSCLLVAASAGGVKTLAASPDCARWIKEYQQGLAKRAAASKKHVVHAARHLGVPRMHLAHTTTPVHRLRPAKLSPQEMLKRFRVLCGEDLPDDTVPVAFVPTGLEAMMVPPALPLDATPVTDLGQPVTFTPTATTPVQQATGGTTPTPTPYTPIVVPGGGTPTTGTGTGTGSPPTTAVPSTPVTTPSPVPEPNSLLLLLTGAVSAAPMVRRRLRA